VQPDEDAETVVLRAVVRHDADVAVVDRHQHFLGSSPSGGSWRCCMRSTWITFFGSEG
jgi:hypothetical protein